MLHQIGVGTLGPVFRTYEPERDRLVAVKAFRLDITPEMAQALADELAAICERMLFHPSIVEPLAAGLEGTAAYRAEEYVAAESLDVLMRQQAPASIETVLLLVTQLSGAIDFARAAGVGHGGLHPRDVFLTPEGEARATGFGVAEALERVGLRAPVRRPYTAPERIAAGPWSTPADVFSLAAIAYELLTGRRPAGLGRELGPLSAGTPNPWMDAVHAVFARAMDQDPEARYQTALAFASDLKAAVQGERAADASALAALAATGRDESVAPTVAPVAAAGAWEREAAAEPMPAWTDDPSPVDVMPEEPPDLLGELPGPGPELVLRGAPEQEQDDERRARHEAEDTTPESPRRALDGQNAFLLHAAGAAAAPGEPVVERFHDIGSGVDVRALEDDEVIPEEAADSSMATEPLPELEADAGPRKPGARERELPRVTPVVAAGAWHDEPAGRRSAWPIAALLVLAVLAGFGGGYALWGRGSSPGAAPGDAGTDGRTPDVAAGGREWSEAPVAPASAEAPAAEPGGSTAASAAPASPAAAGANDAPPATGRLLVRSTPSGAGVTIDGTWRGRTPLTLDDLPLSTYQVRVVQPGFVPATRAVALSAGAPEGTIAVRLEREAPAPPAARTAKPPPPPAARTAKPASASSPAGFTGSIYVDSRPRGARVSVNGKPVGVTPLRIPEMRIGTHVVRMELPDHRIWTSTARVAAGQEARVTGSLEPIQ